MQKSLEDSQLQRHPESLLGELGLMCLEKTGCQDVEAKVQQAEGPVPNNHVT